MGAILLSVAYLLTFLGQKPEHYVPAFALFESLGEEAGDVAPEETVVLGVLVLPVTVDPLDCGLLFYDESDHTVDDVAIVFVQCEVTLEYTTPDLGLPPPVYLEITFLNDTGIDAGNW